MTDKDVFNYLGLIAMFLVLFQILISSCQVPKELKDDPVLKEELQKTRDHHIRHGGKIYREKIDEVLSE